MSEDKIIHWESEDGVVVLRIDDPGKGANTMNAAFKESLFAAIARLEDERQSYTGVVITSAKKTFFAGGDLHRLRAITAAERAQFEADNRLLKGHLRRLEKLGLPVVAAINGAALGGGLEICLSAHHRVAVDDPRVQIGLPEVTLGLLPGGGGVVRTVRLLGVVPALSRVLLSGTRHGPREALEIGLVDELVPTPQELVPAAKAWIARNPAALQPWDADGWEMPGGNPSADEAVLALPRAVRKQLDVAHYPAPSAILRTAVDGARVDFDAAIEIEGQNFAKLASGQVAKNMIQAYFFDMQRVNGKRGRTDDVSRFRAKKVVVLGAGMMGAGIAHVCAKAGIEVVLKDVSREAAERGKDYSKAIVDRSVSRGKSSPQDGESLLERIRPTVEAADAQGAELVIEAVFENPALKMQVLAEVDPFLAPDALLASNTSTLPISELAAGVSRPKDFIGMHFFSPVDKMPLLEIIRGERTSEESLGRALDVAKQIKKTPIVVNDSRGFFTSRVIRTFLNEGIAFLLEGVPPASIEEASSQAGYPAPVLQLRDELNLELTARIRDESKQAVESSGGTWVEHPAFVVIDRMIAAGRTGRLAGAGFYDYADGKRTGLWPGLAEMFPPTTDPSKIDLKELKERMLFVESIETVKCLDEGVIQSVADANVGSLLGIGFPGWTGGVLQYINGYEGGPQGFVARARELAGRHGERFAPPSSLIEKAQRGETYSDEPALAVVA